MALGMYLLHAGFYSAQGDSFYPRGYWIFGDDPVWYTYSSSTGPNTETTAWEALPPACDSGANNTNPQKFSGCPTTLGSDGLYTSARAVAFDYDSRNVLNVITDLGDTLALAPSTKNSDGTIPAPATGSPVVWTWNRNGTKGAITALLLSSGMTVIDLDKDIAELGLRAGRYKPWTQRPLANNQDNWGFFQAQGSPPDFENASRCYDVTRASVFDMRNTGCSPYLFMIPDGNNQTLWRNWYQHAIPFSWRYFPDPKSSGTMSQDFSSSGSDLMQEAGHSNRFGIEATWNFSHQSDVSQKQEAMYKTQQMTSTSRYERTEYILVLDRINTFLSTLLVDDIARLGRPEDLLMPLDFIKKWGTHYAYAVTMGSVGMAHQAYSKSEFSNLVSKYSSTQWAMGYETQVSAGIPGVVDFSSKFGANYSQEQKSQISQKMSNEIGFERTSFECLGGHGCTPSGDTGGGLPLPIHLHLRPITELLGPPFFADYKTAVTLRAKVDSALKTYLLDPSGTKLRTDDSVQGFFAFTKGDVCDDPIEGVCLEPNESKEMFGAPAHGQVDLFSFDNSQYVPWVFEACLDPKLQPPSSVYQCPSESRRAFRTWDEVPPRVVFDVALRSQSVKFNWGWQFLQWKETQNNGSTQGMMLNIRNNYTADPSKLNSLTRIYCWKNHETGEWLVYRVGFYRPEDLYIGLDNFKAKCNLR